MIDGMPPPSRNRRDPTAGDTPAATPASSLDDPSAIASQNRCRCSRRAIGGRPATASQACPPNPTVVAYDQPPQLLKVEVLRRPIESALRPGIAVMNQSARHTAVGVITPPQGHQDSPAMEGSDDHVRHDRHVGDAKVFYPVDVQLVVPRLIVSTPADTVAPCDEIFLWLLWQIPHASTETRTWSGPPRPRPSGSAQDGQRRSSLVP